MLLKRRRKNIYEINSRLWVKESQGGTGFRGQIYDDERAKAELVLAG